MKKISIVFAIVICIFSTTAVFATNTNAINAKTTKATTNSISNEVKKSETMSQLVEIKDNEKKTLEDYQAAYGSETYGLTAYILSKVQIYSIPFCFVGIAISAINQNV